MERAAIQINEGKDQELRSSQCRLVVFCGELRLWRCCHEHIKVESVSILISITYEHNGNLWLAEILWGRTQAGFWHCVRLTQHLLNIRSGYLNLTRRGLRTLCVIDYLMSEISLTNVYLRLSQNPKGACFFWRLREFHIVRTNVGWKSDLMTSLTVSDM